MAAWARQPHLSPFIFGRTLHCMPCRLAVDFSSVSPRCDFQTTGNTYTFHPSWRCRSRYCQVRYFGRGRGPKVEVFGREYASRHRCEKGKLYGICSPLTFSSGVWQSDEKGSLRKLIRKACPSHESMMVDDQLSVRAL